MAGIFDPAAGGVNDAVLVRASYGCALYRRRVGVVKGARI